jgi:endogenous inhibitor of DNA gyrase (YacG/DUF329 family)
MRYTCPICKKKVKLGDLYFPFCSERCRTADLANWAEEKYVIPGAAQPQEQEEDDG